MNDVNNRWRQSILTNKNKDIPILFRRNLNRQIVDKQAEQKEKGGQNGIPGGKEGGLEEEEDTLEYTQHNALCTPFVYFQDQVIYLLRLKCPLEFTEAIEKAAVPTVAALPPPQLWAFKNKMAQGRQC